MAAILRMRPFKPSVDSARGEQKDPLTSMTNPPICAVLWPSVPLAQSLGGTPAAQFLKKSLGQRAVAACFAGAAARDKNGIHSLALHAHSPVEGLCIRVIVGAWGGHELDVVLQEALGAVASPGRNPAQDDPRADCI